MKVPARELQKGSFLMYNGGIYTIVKAEHNFHGRGSANYRFKLKSVDTPASFEVTCKPDNSFDQIDVSSIQMQYLYRTGDSYTFMNEQTYEQFELPERIVSDFSDYMKEGQQVYIMFYDAKT